MSDLQLQGDDCAGGCDCCTDACCCPGCDCDGGCCDKQ